MADDRFAIYGRRYQPVITPMLTHRPVAAMAAPQVQAISR